MRNGTQLAGIAVGALGVAVALRGIFHSGGWGMIAAGVIAATAGLTLIFRGHYR